MSAPRSASSARMVTTPWLTSRKPPATKMLSSVPCSRMRSSPRASVVSRGAWRGRMPSWPSLPGAITISASPSKTVCCAVTIFTCSVGRCDTTRPPSSRLLLLLGLRALDHVFDGPGHVEVDLGDGVVLALEDLFEAADRVRQRDGAPWPTGEDLADVERLREELLDFAGAADGQLVVVGELVHAEDGDDVLQVFVTLQDALDLLRHVVVLLADDVRVEDAAGRGQRIHRWEEAAGGEGALQHEGGVEVGEGGGRRRIGIVVGGDEDRLHRGDGALLGGGD